MNANDNIELNAPPLVLVYEAKDTLPYYASSQMIEKTAWRLRHFALDGALLNRFDGKERKVVLSEMITQDENAPTTTITVKVFISEDLHE